MFFRKYSLKCARAALALNLVVALLGMYPAQADAIDAGWAQSLGGSLVDYGADLAIDGQDNVYMAGFTTAGTGTRDIIVQKLNAGGAPAWSRTIGGDSDDYGQAVAVDDAGNIYITGYFSQTVDFDPGLGITNLTSYGYGDIFLVKLNSDGDLIWAKQLGGPDIDAGFGLIVKGGNIYLVGAFSDTADFDPGPGTQNFTSQGSTDIFITKLDSDGNALWTKSLGGASTDTSFDVALDEFGNVFTVGYFSDSVDFDPGQGTSQRTSAGETDLFVHKLDPNGNFIWASQGAGIKSDAAVEVRLDGSGNAYVTGYFNDALYFDSGPGVIGAGSNEIFVCKLDTAGNPLWIKAMGGTSFDSGYGVAVDRNGNVYTTGEFAGTADFDPGESVNHLTSAGSSDIFLSKLDAEGDFIWAKKLGSDGYDTGEGIAVGSNDQLYLTGAYSNTVDFDPGIDVTNLTSAGSVDIFVSKLVFTSQIRYVKHDANGSNTGTSWNDAFTDLQSALASASNGDEIWVAAGTYKPTSGTDRAVSFVLKNGVAMYGGFTGTETSLSQRDYQTNVTILSGDIGVAGDTKDNSYHVVIGSDTNNSAVLDGFTITGGNANVSPSDKGGGMYNFHGSPSLTNLIITKNYATFGGGMNNESLTLSESSNPNLSNVSFIDNSALEGGGMRNMNYSSPTLDHVKFQDNTVIRAGGGMLNFYQNNVTMHNVEFSGNTAGTGGGLANAGSDPILENVTFSSNSAEWGGAISNGYSNPTITNATFYGNSATTYGGAISNESDSNPTLTNVTISGNSAVTYGGGIYNDHDGANVRNSILYGNSGGEIYNLGGSANVSYSIVQGGYQGTGNIDADPLLGSLRDNGDFTLTMALLPGSPAIHAGDNAVCPSTDQRGVARPQGSRCDIGAYESLSPIFPGDTARISVSSNGGQGDNSSYKSAISADGRYIAFTSYATNLVSGDTNEREDIFVYDTQMGTIKRVSVDSNGAQANGGSHDPAISENGRYVVFASHATNLVVPYTLASNIFIHDMLTGTTTLAAITPGGMHANGNSSAPSISADGRYVAFESHATNLVSNDTNGKNDIFVYDVQSGITTRSSVDSNNTQANNDSYYPSISADGRYIAFESYATNLVSDDTNGKNDIFIHDRQTGITTRVSVDSSGVQGNNVSYDPSISADGRSVAFQSYATNLVSGDTNNTYDIFVRNLQTGMTTRVSVDSNGTQANSQSQTPSISADGRHTAFTSYATNLISEDSNTSYPDIFMHDMQTGMTTLVSVNSNGIQADGSSYDPAISADGYYVGFTSDATNLVSGDSNAHLDIFVHRQRDIPMPPTEVLLVEPTGTLTTWNNIFTWKGLADAEYYHLEVYDGADTKIFGQWFTNSICSGLSCAVSPAETLGLSGGDFKWRVQSYGAGVFGPWTEFMSFTINAVALELIAPSGALDNWNHGFRWTGLSSAEYYHLELRDAGSDAVLQDLWLNMNSCMGLNCTASPVETQNLANGNYKWRLQTYGSTGYTAWSEYVTFTLDAPLLVQTSPLGTLLNWDTTLRWTGIPSAEYYHTQVYDGQDNLVQEEWYNLSICSGLDCAVSPSETRHLANGEYKWRVQTYGTLGYTPWTSYATFTIDKPVVVLTAPLGTLSDWDTILRWTGIPSAEYYHTQVFDAMDTLVQEEWYNLSICSGLECAVNPTETRYLVNGEYKWRVQTYGTEGYTPWTEFTTFTLSAPVVVLNAPTGTLTSWNNSFQWMGIPGAEYYHLQVYNASTDVLVQEEWYTLSICNGSLCAVSPAETLNLPNGDYKWRVQTYGNEGYTAWTPFQNFTLDQ